MTYGRHTAAMEFCVTASADADIVELVERANNGEVAKLATEWSCGTLQKVLDRLSGCVALGCAFHTNKDAVQKLQTILDEAAEEDAQWAAEKAMRDAEEDARDEGRVLTSRQLGEIMDRAYWAAKS